MSVLKAKLEKLLAEAEDCDLIARLAVDPVKRQSFRKRREELRSQYDAMMKDDLSANSRKSFGGPVRPD